MQPAEIIFWLLIFLVFYTYIGYGILLFVLVKIKRLFSKPGVSRLKASELPAVTVIIAAYNEEDCIEAKILNCLALDYPMDKVEYWFVTDGSTDKTPGLVQFFPNLTGHTIRLFHQPERKGKIAAVERIMPLVNTPITIFTDANTEVNSMAIRNIVRHFDDPHIGAVAGEKRIATDEKNDASGAGEGIYWRYESLLKKWDAELWSAIGAAGELFAVRTDLYHPVAHDSIIEDFVMTMKIAMRGYRIAYEAEAFASEKQSASIREELKRKIRIAAGGLQALVRLSPLLNPLRYGILSFQYISHRVLRWTFAPLALPLIFVLNIMLLSESVVYQVLLVLQLVFYAFALAGYLLERRKMKWKVFFVPYYFCVMNYAMYRGFFRLLAGRQSVLWEKARRA